MMKDGDTKELVYFRVNISTCGNRGIAPIMVHKHSMLILLRRSLFRLNKRKFVQGYLVLL